MVERFNKTFASLLRQFGNQAQDDQDELLSICALTYNSSSSTSYSSNFLIFGHDFRVPIELVSPNPEIEVPDLSCPTSVDHYVMRLQDTHVYEHTRLNLGLAVMIKRRLKENLK